MSQEKIDELTNILKSFPHKDNSREMELVDKIRACIGQN